MSLIFWIGLSWSVGFVVLAWWRKFSITVRDVAVVFVLALTTQVTIYGSIRDDEVLATIGIGSMLLFFYLSSLTDSTREFVLLFIGGFFFFAFSAWYMVTGFEPIPDDYNFISIARMELNFGSSVEVFILAVVSLVGIVSLVLKSRSTLADGWELFDLESF